MKNFRLLSKSFFLIPVVFTIFVICLGTARQANADTEVSGVINTDTTWTVEGSPYVVTSNIFIYHSISNGPVATLTIEAGVEVRFRSGAGLYIGYRWGDNYGALVVNGTSDLPVIFTSDSESPSAGSWQGIYFYSNASSSSVLNHCVVEYAGGFGAGIQINNSSPTIEDCTVMYSSQKGIYLNGSSATISHSYIHDNNGDGISGSGNAHIEDCEISNNGASGIYWEGSAPNITRNNILDNHGYAILVATAVQFGSIQHNTAQGNESGDVLGLIGGSINSDRVWGIRAGLPLVVIGNIFIYHSTGNGPVATLTIEAGVEVRFRSGAGLYIGYRWGDNYGALVVNGTSDLPVIFTSDSESPSAGSWQGIYFYSSASSSSALNHCVVEYAGGFGAGIQINDVSPTIQNSTIRHNTQNGIYLNGTGCNGCTISNNDFTHLSHAIHVSGNAQPTIRHNNFLQNITYGVYNDGTAEVDAHNNWWGDNQGPGFSGADVYGNVNYTPWLIHELSDADPDGDGILSDGDSSGVVGDNPCADGVTQNCDDNCPTVFNSLQLDSDGDGTGDSCERIYDNVIKANRTIGPDDDSLDNTSFTVDGSVLVISGAHNFENISLINGAVITHLPNGIEQLNSLDLRVSGDLFITQNSAIDLHGKGYTSGNGPGAGIYQYPRGGGAGHGGMGGDSDTGATGGAAYDSLTDPSGAGSGGGNAGGTPGGSGGGILRLSVDGVLINNGRISADGQDGTGGGGWCSGGGSGGSINITAGTISGTGSITANGGDALIFQGTGGGGGAGGCIALHYDSYAYEGELSAYGGSGYRKGGPGTIYYKSPDSGNEYLRIDNGDEAGSRSVLRGRYGRLTLIGNSIIEPDEALSVSELRLEGNVLVLNGEHSFDKLTLINAQLIYDGNVDSLKNRLDLSVSGDFLIDSNSSIILDYKGYTSGNGPGAGTYQYPRGGGAGHGGMGGDSDTGATGGAAYDSLTDPSEVGSGGGNAGGTPGGSGGGVLRLRVGGIFTNNGIISANGQDGTGGGGWCSGGGSGGSINITAGTFQGTGTIRANGGDALIFQGTGGGGGAGGRIALHYFDTRPAPDAFPNVTVTGGTGYNAGEDGTIHISHAATPRITTNNGLNFTTSNPAIVLEGTCLEDIATIYVNDSSDGVERIDSTHWQYHPELQEGINSFSVSAEDADGNRSGYLHIEIILDTTPSGAPVITNNEGGDLTVTSAAFTLTGTCDADVARILVNDSDEGVAYTPGSGQWSMQTELVPGDNVFVVTAVDGIGNVSPPDSITVIFDNIVPGRPVNKSPPHGSSDNLPALSLSASEFEDANEGDSHVASQWQLRLPSDPEYEAPVIDTGADSTNLTSYSIPYGILELDSTYLWRVRYKDSRGSWSPWSVETSFNTLADTLPPDTTITSGPSDGGSIGSASVTFAWSGIDNVQWNLSWSYMLDEGQWSEFADITQQSFTNLSDGEHVFSVKCRDYSGNVDPEPATVHFSVHTAPEEVTGLSIESHATSLVLSWNPSANSFGDLAVYRIYVDSGSAPVELDANVTSYELSGLEPATAHTFRVATVDTNGNESQGVSITGYTLLENPSGLSAEPFSAYVELKWNAISQASYLRSFNIYVSESDFQTTEGMQPVLATKGTSIRVAGLSNNTTYYFAVTSVNLSGGEDNTVTTVTATPVPDTVGPEASSLTAGGDALESGMTLTAPTLMSLAASDPSGVSRVEFYVDGTLEHTASSGAGGYSWLWDVARFADGSHTLEIRLRDTLNNETVLTYTVNIALAPPEEAPVITAPIQDTVVNSPSVRVTGTADASCEVMLYKNGSPVDSWRAVADDGSFSLLVQLEEGENLLQARMRNRGGEGPLSQAVHVTLDTTIPDAPRRLEAVSRPGGAVRLTWDRPLESAGVRGYRVFRSDSAFESASEAQVLNPVPLTSTGFTDLPAEDGTYYYSVTTVDLAGNESPLSNSVSAVSDRVPPRITDIHYSPEGPYDRATGRMGPGLVNVEISLSEELQTEPFITVNAPGTVPVSLQLRKESDTSYSGFFIIQGDMPTGQAYVVFSGRDMAGNRGTDIDSGRSIVVDTSGPAVIRLDVTPASPARNDSNSTVVINAEFGLDERLPGGQMPYLGYLLSGNNREETEISDVEEISPKEGEAQAFRASFQLPADAGLDETEYLQFVFRAADDLGNNGTEIKAANRLEIFQGELPPLPTPLGFNGSSMPHGQISLDWYEVEGAAAYQLYRKGPDDTELLPYQRIDGTSFVDDTENDGTYQYAVSSIRQAAGLESLSAPSEPVILVADSVPPESPTNLELELTSRGILARWQPGNAYETVTYSLYRSSDASIESVDGLTPLATGIEQTEVIDPTPSNHQHCYVVTAVDSAGNESVPSNSFYLNFGLLPVSAIEVVQHQYSVPEVSWSASGSPAGFDIYLGEEESRIKLNQEPLSTTSFTDLGYDHRERIYTVVAKDENGVESLARSILLPDVDIHLLNGSDISEFVHDLNSINAFVGELESIMSSLSLPRRGLMNRLSWLVHNNGEHNLENLRLNAGLGGRNHVSETFELAPGEYRIVSVIVGGYSDLADVSILTETLVYTPEQNATVRIEASREVEVGDGMLVAGIQNQEFVRGVSGTVRFTLENTGSEEIEVVTATNAGASPSDEIVFRLRDRDGNIISVAGFRQAVGATITTLPDGRSVAGIAPGEMFESAPLELAVPASAPDEAVIELSINAVHYHAGRDDHVVMQGLSSTYDISLVDTSYYGQVLSVTPEASFGSEHVIRGRAVERKTGSPLPYAALELVIANKGFERKYDVTTSEDGNFTFTFTPLPEESGLYTVYAVHPDLKDRSPQATFTINRVLVSPATFQVEIPRNYQQTLNITVKADEGTDLSNLRLVSSEIPQGIHLDTGSAIPAVQGGNQATLAVTLWADNTASETVSLNIKVASDEAPDGGWADVVVDAHFTEARPALDFTPTYIETGLAQEDIVTESIILENSGLAELEDVSLELVTEDGEPAPAWVQIASASEIGNLAVGEKSQVDISFHPDTTVYEGYHTFFLRVTCSNYPQTDIGIYAAVMQEGQGSVLFKVSDIYTGTFDEDDMPVEGVSGARIKIQNETITDIVQSAQTDTRGEALFENLPAGSYLVRVSAPDHQDYLGRVTVRPGITVTESIFLKYDLVTVEWEVVPVTIEDRYEIVLNTTFKTSVPAAEVVAEPASVNLPEMHAGDVYNGEFTLTNYGLIQAEDVKLTVPPDDEFFHYEISQELPEVILPYETVVVPYRVVCLKSPAMDDEMNSSGGGCHHYTREWVVDYGYECINGKWELVATRYLVIYDNNECSASGGGGGFLSGLIGGGGTQNVQASSGGGAISPSPSFAPDPLEGVEDNCEPEQELREKDKPKPCYQCVYDKKDSQQNECCQSSVNLRTGQYLDDLIDLAVKVPGGMIKVKRQYYDHNWHWFHVNEPLRITSIGLYSSGGGGGSAGYVLSSDKSDLWGCSNNNKDIGDYVVHRGVKYWFKSDGRVVSDKKVETNLPDFWLNGVFVHDTYRIRKLPDGMRWEDQEGNWELYDEDGYMSSYGNRSGLIGKLIYEDFTAVMPAMVPYHGKRVIGVLDRNNRQVLWFSYVEDHLSNSSPLRIASIHDNAGRSVSYSYLDQDIPVYAFSPATTKTVANNTGAFVGVTARPFDLLRPIVTFTDILGYETHYEYNVRNQLAKKYKPDGPVVTISYDSSGHVSSVYTDNGTAQYFGHNYDRSTENVMSTVRYTSGRTKTVWYDSCGDTIRYDLNGRNIFKVIKQPNRQLIEVDGNGLVTRKTYDEWERLTHIINPDGSEISIEYEHDFGLPVRIVNELGVVTTMNYDASGNLVRLVEAEGTADERVTQQTYNSMGQVLTSTVSAADGSDAATTTYTYDENGNLTSVQDPEGNTVRYGDYDNMGNAHTITDARGNTWHVSYNAKGKMTSVTDPLGHSYTFSWNMAGDLVKVVDPAGNVTEMEYDKRHNRVLVRDALGGELKTFFDLNNMPVTIIDKSGHSSSAAFDNDLRMTAQTDPAGNKISFHYDSTAENPAPPYSLTSIDYPTFIRKLSYDDMGRAVRAVDILDDSTSYETLYDRDRRGNITGVTDPEGRVTRYEYDSFDRLVRIIQPGNVVTEMKYDVRGNLVQLTNPNSGTTYFVYDRADRLIKEQRPLGQETSYSYDPNGNLTSITDPLGRMVAYQYDAVNRLVAIRYYSASDHENPEKEIHFTFNALGLLTSYDDGQTSATYEWDELGRKTGEHVNYGDFTLSYHYEYFANGLKKSYTAPNGDVYEYSYDSGNRLVGIELPGLGSITYNGFTWNAPAQITLPGGGRIGIDYDALMRVKELHQADPGGNVVQFRVYEYSPLNLTSKETEHGLYTYQYDELSRLVAAANPEADDESYSYDRVGNRTASGNSTWRYNLNDELIDNGDVQFSYDAAGNMVSRVADGVETHFIYDAGNHLIRVTEGEDTVIATYYYDPFGRRLWKETGGSRTYYFYNDEGIAGEYAQDGTELKIYGFAPGGTWSTNPIYQKSNGVYYFYLNDHLGTPQQMMDSSGRIVWKARYDSFGACTVPVNEVENNLRFPGQYYDAETGLHYNWHRYYAPELGRYITADPIGFAGGINLYAYVGGNPVMGIDYEGFANQIKFRAGTVSFDDNGYVTEISGNFPLGEVTLSADGVNITKGFDLKKLLPKKVNKYANANADMCAKLDWSDLEKISFRFKVTFKIKFLKHFQKKIVIVDKKYKIELRIKKAFKDKKKAIEEVGGEWLS